MLKLITSTSGCLTETRLGRRSIPIRAHGHPNGTMWARSTTSEAEVVQDRSSGAVISGRRTTFSTMERVGHTSGTIQARPITLVAAAVRDRSNETTMSTKTSTSSKVERNAFQARYVGETNYFGGGGRSRPFKRDDDDIGEKNFLLHGGAARLL